VDAAGNPLERVRAGGAALVGRRANHLQWVTWQYKNSSETKKI